ncbi:MAG: hypothetical protein U9Q33_00585 [Campylobacterota bacterium]|nr:hypothetical protein [Campylobacterota bacterium]
MSENQKREKDWSWFGFLFAPHYYAGYGQLNKGIILAVISGLMPLFGIVVGVYGGLKAKQELPIGNLEYNWKNAGITIAIVIIVSIVSMTLIQFIKG